MVREGKRHETLSGDPAADRAKYQSVSESFTGMSSGEGKRRKFVCTPESFQPKGVVKYARFRVRLNEFPPSRIFQRVDCLNKHGPRPFGKQWCNVLALALESRQRAWKWLFRGRCSSITRLCLTTPDQWGEAERGTRVRSGGASAVRTVDDLGGGNASCPIALFAQAVRARSPPSP